MAVLTLAILVQSLPVAAQPPTAPLAKPQRDYLPIAVFGPDDRAALPQTHAGLAAKIGVLAIGDSPFCTAFCVGPDVIATASHCLLGTEQTPGPDLERVSFNAGAAGEFSSRLSGSSRAAMRAGLRSGTPLLHITPPIAAANDWAIARLAKPVCTAGGLPLTSLSREAIDDLAARGELYQIALHRDLATKQVVFGGPCSISHTFPQAGETTIAQDFIDPPAILMHTCDTGPGSSGSPLLADGKNGPEVVGINVGTYVLSRTSTSTSSASAPARASEAIANTAIAAPRFKSAVELFTLETASVPSHTLPRNWHPPR